MRPAVVVTLALAGCDATGVGACEPALDPEALPALRLTLSSFEPIVELQPGDTRTFSVIVGYGWDAPMLTGCDLEWSVTPPAGASIDADGTLAVDTNALPGTVYSVTATIAGSAPPITASTEVWIYTPATHPLVGSWEERTRIDCGGQEIIPAYPVRELRMFANKLTHVTWHPFETYVDYWGTANVAANGEVNISDVGGNYIPANMDLVGRLAIDNDLLVFSDMFFGSDKLEPPTLACGHRFARQ